MTRTHVHILRNLVAAAGLAACAVQADGLHMVAQGQPDAAAQRSVSRQSSAEASMANVDPAAEAEFARYADLHRDTLGYVLADTQATSMLARASGEAAANGAH